MSETHDQFSHITAQMLFYTIKLISEILRVIVFSFKTDAVYYSSILTSDASKDGQVFLVSRER